MQDQRAKKDVYRKNGQDRATVQVDCWCRCQTVVVDAAELRAGRTGSCGRRLCTALGYSQALTADGAPCDCGARGKGLS